MNFISPRNWLVSIFALGLICAPSAFSQKADKEYKLSQWSFGKVLFGEKLNKNDLKGKVVLIENWGVQCPPCIAAMPHLAELDKKHRSEGLVIIGAECQGHDKKDIKPIIEKANAEFTITENAEGPIEFDAIPRCHIFGRDGVLVYDGSPSGPGFETAIKEALAAGGGAEAEIDKSAPKGPLIASRGWTNSEGKTITAAVKSVDGTSIVFIMPNGKEMTYQLDKLSEESRQTIAAATKSDKDASEE